jgi:hypothetical protein
MKPEKIYFNPDEVEVIAMGLAIIMQDYEATKQLPWDPVARKTQAETIASARSAAAKLEKFAGIKCDLPPYDEGDENKFFTKES